MIERRRQAAAITSSINTLKLTSVLGPKDLLIATSMASLPLVIKNLSDPRHIIAQQFLSSWSLLNLHPVRRRQIVPGISDQLAIAWMIYSLHARDDFH